MDQILVYIKDEKKYYKAISNTKLYDINIDNVIAIDYSQNTILEEGQWFAIKHFVHSKYAIDIIKTQCLDSTQFELLKKFNLDNISYILSYQQEYLFCFQKVYRSSCITKKNITISEHCKIVNSPNQIIINSLPDAIYNARDDILYFRALEKISGIFIEIMDLYKEATDNDVENFIKQDFIVCDNNFSSDDVGKLSRKYLLSAKEKYDKFDNNVKDNLYKYIKEYCSQLKVINKKVHIASDAELRSLLCGINEKYYTSELTKEKRLANSYIRL